MRVYGKGECIPREDVFPLSGNSVIYFGYPLYPNAVGMDKPIINPNLNDLVGIFGAITMMCNKPYLEVVETTEVDILRIVARENYPYEICSEHLHALRFIGHDKGIFMSTLQL